jgi:8-oxo-dGTP diphosphatase
MIRTPIQALVWQALPFWAQRVILWLSNTHFVVGTAALVRDGNNRILLARHTYRRRAPWGLLGGWVRRGESPDETVVREVREETALDVEVTHLLAVRSESPAHLTVVYEARLIGGTFRPSAEVSEVLFIERGVWPEGLRKDHRVLIERFGWRPAPYALG